MKAIDLFAGAGGFTIGAEQAGCSVVWAANHWPAAVAIHSDNHPVTSHSCQDLQQADWTAVPAFDLLLASPACQGHSYARGTDRPHHDALRSTAWAVVSAAECHKPAALIVENVPEFAKWSLYTVWCSALHQLGYALEMQIIDAADHGAAQNRKRLFIIGTRTQYPIQLDLPQRPHVPARDVIDFDAGHWSRVDKPGRSAGQIKRWRAGRARHGERFLTAYYGRSTAGRSLDRPIGTLTTKDRYAVIRGNDMRMLSVAEARTFMGFPADYSLPSTHTGAMKMLGNAVVPAVARDVIAGVQACI